LSLAAFGVFSLVSSFVTYLVVVQGAVSGATLQGLGGATTVEERDRAFTTAFLVQTLFGFLAAVIVGIGGLALVEVLHIPQHLRTDARTGVLALAVLTLIGWPARAFADALRGIQRFALASGCEVAAYAVFTVMMLVLVVVVKPPLWVLIAAGGSSPALIGLTSGIAILVTRASVHIRLRSTDPGFARQFLGVSLALLVISGSDILITSLDRTIVGLFRPASVVALYEGAARPATLVRALAGSLVRTVLPASAQFHAQGDLARLRALVLRGTRYVVAGTLPVTIVITVLAGPILDVWLGKRYAGAATALAIFTGAWILGANSSVIGSALVGVGRQGKLILYTWGAAVLNVALSLALTPLIGLTGVVLGTTASYAVFFPVLMWITVTNLPITIADLAREVWLPAYSLGAALAALLLVIRLAVPLETLLALAVVGAAGMLAYWGAFYALWLRPDERQLIKGLLRVGRNRSQLAAST
jgi:O-antigen/teichoic acid export membrane protein